MKKHFTIWRIILIVILILVLVVNYNLRQRPYKRLNELIDQNTPSYSTLEAKGAEAEINEQVNKLLYFALNSNDSTEYLSKINSGELSFLKMTNSEIVKKFKISNKKDIEKFSKYMPKIMDIYFQVLSEFKGITDIKMDSQRNFIERYYYFDF